jgi:hypothetical protein
MSFPKTQWDWVRGRAALKDFHFHDQRHIFVCECCDAGVSVEDTADLSATATRLSSIPNRTRKLAFKERGMAARTKMINERRDLAAARLTAPVEKQLRAPDAVGVENADVEC